MHQGLIPPQDSTMLSEHCDLILALSDTEHLDWTTGIDLKVSVQPHGGVGSVDLWFVQPLFEYFLSFDLTSIKGLSFYTTQLSLQVFLTLTLDVFISLRLLWVAAGFALWNGIALLHVTYLQMFEDNNNTPATSLLFSRLKIKFL